MSQSCYIWYSVTQVWRLAPDEHKWSKVYIHMYNWYHLSLRKETTITQNPLWKDMLRDTWGEGRHIQEERVASQGPFLGLLSQWPRGGNSLELCGWAHSQVPGRTQYGNCILCPPDSLPTKLSQITCLASGQRLSSGLCLPSHPS